MRKSFVLPVLLSSLWWSFFLRSLRCWPLFRHILLPFFRYIYSGACSFYLYIFFKLTYTSGLITRFCYWQCVIVKVQHQFFFLTPFLWHFMNCLNPHQSGEQYIPPPTLYSVKFFAYQLCLPATNWGPGAHYTYRSCSVMEIHRKKAPSSQLLCWC